MIKRCKTNYLVYHKYLVLVNQSKFVYIDL